MLQEYLDLNWINIAEDSNLTKLKKASGELAKQLKKTPAKIAPYTLVAFDPEISADNSVILEVKGSVTTEWATFTSNVKDTPVTYIRAVMLEALSIVSEDNELASLIWLTARNIVKHYKLGREKEMLTKFLIELGSKVEAKAHEDWSFTPETEIESPELTPAAIDKAEIETVFKAATIHKPWGQGGENPHPHAQNDVNWPSFFATNVSKGLTDILNKTLKKHAKEIINNQREFFSQSSYLQMRTQLLWWKESCYSVSAKCGYRDLKQGVLELLLAVDYSALIPGIYPASVDYFLRETHSIISNRENKIFKVIDIFNLIKQEDESIKMMVPEQATDDSRVSLFCFLNGLISGKFSVTQFKSKVGIDENTEISLSELTLWLFHDLHSLKIMEAY